MKENEVWDVVKGLGFWKNDAVGSSADGVYGKSLELRIVRYHPMRQWTTYSPRCVVIYLTGCACGRACRIARSLSL